jgi:hypothetical protein
VLPGHLTPHEEQIISLFERDDDSSQHELATFRLIDHPEHLITHEHVLSRTWGQLGGALSVIPLEATVISRASLLDLWRGTRTSRDIAHDAAHHIRATCDQTAALAERFWDGLPGAHLTEQARAIPDGALPHRTVVRDEIVARTLTLREHDADRWHTHLRNAIAHTTGRTVLADGTGRHPTGSTSSRTPDALSRRLHGWRLRHGDPISGGTLVAADTFIVNDTLYAINIGRQHRIAGGGTCIDWPDDTARRTALLELRNNGLNSFLVLADLLNAFDHTRNPGGYVDAVSSAHTLWRDGTDLPDATLTAACLHHVALTVDTTMTTAPSCATKKDP